MQLFRSERTLNDYVSKYCDTLAKIEFCCIRYHGSTNALLASKNMKNIEIESMTGSHDYSKFLLY